MGIIYLIGGLAIGGLLFYLLNSFFDIMATSSWWIGALGVCFIIGAFLTGLIFKFVGSLLALIFKIVLIVGAVAAVAALGYYVYTKFFKKADTSNGQNTEPAEQEAAEVSDTSADA